MFPSHPVWEKICGGHARISRRFKVRNNLGTAAPPRGRDTQGQNVASRDIPSLPPAPHPLSPWPPPHPTATRGRGIAGHLRAGVPLIFMEIQLLTLSPSRYTGSTSATSKGKRAGTGSG
jgi:hypothetical protein